jgi:hypothetical protein
MNRVRDDLLSCPRRAEHRRGEVGTSDLGHLLGDGADLRAAPHSREDAACVVDPAAEGVRVLECLRRGSEREPNEGHERCQGYACSGADEGRVVRVERRGIAFGLHSEARCGWLIAGPMTKKNKPSKWKLSARKPAGKTFGPGTLCSCGCKQLAEIVFGDELPYTRACMQRTIDELRAAGIPIEQSSEGVRLGRGVSVSIVDDGDPTKIH